MRAVRNIFEKLGRLITVPADETIVSQGTSLSRAFYISSGQVLLHYGSLWGREIAFEVVRSGGVVGYSSVCSDPHAFFAAKTLAKTEMLVLERNAFQRAVLGDVDATQEVFDALRRFLRRQTVISDSFAAPTVKARLARWLASQFEHHGVPIQRGARLHIDFSQSLIAAFSASTREGVNRHLKDWEKTGVLTVSGRVFEIQKPEVLLQLAGLPSKTLAG